MKLFYFMFGFLILSATAIYAQEDPFVKDLQWIQAFERSTSVALSASDPSPDRTEIDQVSGRVEIWVNGSRGRRDCCFAFGLVNTKGYTLSVERVYSDYFGENWYVLLKLGGDYITEDWPKMNPVVRSVRNQIGLGYFKKHSDADRYMKAWDHLFQVSQDKYSLY